MEGLPAELLSIYQRVRQALADYDLDAARPYLDVPPGEPDPTREQARMLVDFLPDLSTARYLAMRQNGARVGLYFETDRDNAQTSEVTVLRLQQVDGGYKLCRDTFQSNSTDPVSEAELLARIEQPDLAV